MEQFLGDLWTFARVNAAGVALAAALTMLSIWFYRKQKFVRAAAMLATSLAFLVFTGPLLVWAFELGVDSLSEAQDFSFQEARFFVTTLAEILTFRSAKAYLGLFLGWIFLVLLLWRALTWRPALARTYLTAGSGIVLICGGYLGVTVHDRYIDNSRLFEATARNFEADLGTYSRHRNDLDALIYIGESTSSLNLSLYGYPRPTTPNLESLSALPGFLKFAHVLSPHTHTSPSLLEALSIGQPASDGGAVQSIYDKKRNSIVSVLKAAGVRTVWISNQNRSGTWNLASSIIARESDIKIWSVSNTFAPNAMSALELPYDEDFIDAALARVRVPGTASAIFLHSRAGHGPYAESIPEPYRHAVDDYFSGRSSRSIFGNRRAATSRELTYLENYDSALTYIDHAVSTVIRKYVIASARPTVFIYFSDHGESVYAARGHDSSRFVFEMFAIPFVVFFNDAARTKFPAQFAELAELAKSKRPLSSAIVSPILIRLFDIDVASESGAAVAANGLARVPSALVIRDALEGKSAVALDRAVAASPNLSIANDAATDLFWASNIAEKRADHVCYHRSNSLGKAFRGLSASGCIEFDVVVEDGQIWVYHPPDRNTGLPIGSLWEAAGARAGSIWIDAKNINQSEACRTLADFVRRQSAATPLQTVLVEFPPTTDVSDDGIAECAKSLQASGASTSYYVATGQAIECAKPPDAAGGDASRDECTSLTESLRAVAESGLFTDVSFNYHGYGAIAANPSVDRLRWNTWDVNARSVEDLPRGRFRLVITTSADDPNQP